MRNEKMIFPVQKWYVPLTNLRLCLLVVLFSQLKGEKISTILKAANVDVEPYWPSLFAKALEGINVKDLITNIGSGVGAAPAAGGAPAAASAAPAAAEKKEEKKKEESEEEEDDDMGFGMYHFNSNWIFLASCAAMCNWCLFDMMQSH